MLFLKGVSDVVEEVAKRAKEQRLQIKLTQRGLANRSGVTLASIKRFEQTGKISFESLVKISFVLDSHTQFDRLFVEQEHYDSIDDVIASEKKRKRGSIK